jgi:hypothetical protein
VTNPTAWLEEVNDLLVAHDKDMTDVATLKILIHQAQKLVSDAIAHEEYMEAAKYLDDQSRLYTYGQAVSYTADFTNYVPKDPFTKRVARTGRWLWR